MSLDSSFEQWFHSFVMAGALNKSKQILQIFGIFVGQTFFGVDKLG